MSKPREITLVADAARMLAEALTVHDIKKVIRQEAEAKAGELLSRTSLHRGGRPSENPSRLASGLTTLADFGVTADEPSRYQAVAAVPAAMRAGYVARSMEREEEITRAGLLPFAQRPVVAYNGGDVKWYSPAEYSEAARATMGGIDLDPASTAVANTVVLAETDHTHRDDGLEQAWHGRVWLNPPCAHGVVPLFAAKLISEVAAGTVEQACTLVNNATETAWFRSLADAATAICFPTSRVRFWHPHRDSIGPLQGQAVLYFGLGGDAFRAEFGRFGFLVSSL
jgi:hypothetical protein